MIEIKFEVENYRSAAYDGDKLVGMAEFSVANDVWTITHTETDPNYGGQGIGKRLIKCLVLEARASRVKIVPLCSFAAKEFEKNSDYMDVKED